jgi:hypothetical protein
VSGYSGQFRSHGGSAGNDRWNSGSIQPYDEEKFKKLSEPSLKYRLRKKIESILNDASLENLQAALKILQGEKQ